jgi:hypothetical protein
VPIGILALALDGSMVAEGTYSGATPQRFLHCARKLADGSDQEFCCELTGEPDEAGRYIYRELHPALAQYTLGGFQPGRKRASYRPQ